MPEPPAPLIEVTAGPLVAQLEGIDLRYVTLGETELVRRLHAAVRDVGWGTVPARIENAELERGERSFTLRFEAVHAAADLKFRWCGLIEGTANGLISYRLDGAAERSFLHNRIGLCALLPPETWAARPLEVAGVEGRSETTLPRLIAPQLAENGVEQPAIGPFHGLRLDLGSGLRSELRFAGDEFELEDQRNWGDASFKAYSTPLALGYPHRLAAGERITQAIELAVEGPAEPGPSRSGVPSWARRRPTVHCGDPIPGPPPALGTVIGPEGCPPAAERALRDCAFEHLRIDLRDDDPGALARLAAASELAVRADARLEVGLEVSGDGAGRPGPLPAAIASSMPERILVFAADGAELTSEETTPPASVERVRRLARAAGITAPIGGGSAVGFVALNRTRPDPAPLEALAFPFCPTVHADDERSIVETLSSLPALLATARAIAPALPIAVTPITLAADRGKPDPRLGSQFAAAWTLGCVAALAEARAASATFYEAAGAAGIVADSGAATPVAALFARLAGWRTATVHRLRCEVPFLVDGLLIQAAGKAWLLLANLTAKTLELRLRGLPATAGLTAESVELSPYAVLCIDG